MNHSPAPPETQMIYARLFAIMVGQEVVPPASALEEEICAERRAHLRTVPGIAGYWQPARKRELLEETYMVIADYKAANPNWNPMAINESVAKWGRS